MVTELDIYRSAMIFIKKYGDQAKEEAARQGLTQLDHLDSVGLSVWCRIVAAIDKIQSDDEQCIN